MCRCQCANRIAISGSRENVNARKERKKKKGTKSRVKNVG